MAGRQQSNLKIFQCKNCRNILSDSSSSLFISDTTRNNRAYEEVESADEVYLSAISSGVKLNSGSSPELKCTVCNKIVGRYQTTESSHFWLDTSKITRTTVGKGTQDRKIAELESKVEEQNSKIVELGIQAIQNRFDIINLQRILVLLHPNEPIEDLLAQYADD